MLKVMARVKRIVETTGESTFLGQCPLASENIATWKRRLELADNCHFTSAYDVILKRADSMLASYSSR